MELLQENLELMKKSLLVKVLVIVQVVMETFLKEVSRYCYFSLYYSMKSTVIFKIAEAFALFSIKKHADVSIGMFVIEKYVFVLL